MSRPIKKPDGKKIRRVYINKTQAFFIAGTHANNRPSDSPTDAPLMAQYKKDGFEMVRAMCVHNPELPEAALLRKAGFSKKEIGQYMNMHKE